MNKPGTISVPFSEGIWMPDRDPARIGHQNFSEMQNVKYSDTHPVGVSGYERINFAPLGFLSYYPTASGDDGHYSGIAFDSSANSVGIGANIPASWVTRFDNTRWEASLRSGMVDPHGAWSGSLWTSVEDILWCIDLRELGTWVDSYRPDKIKAEFSGPATVLLMVYDKNGAVILIDPAYISGAEASITFAGYDIDWLLFFGTSAVSVTNIEFS